MKKMFIVTLSLLLLLASISPTYAEANFIEISPESEINFNINQKEKLQTVLPEHVIQYLQKETKEEKLVSSTVTIHYMEKENAEVKNQSVDSKEFIRDSKSFDLSNEEDLKEFVSELERLKSKNPIETQNVSEKDHHYIIVGLNVTAYTPVDPRSEVGYQLQGWWEWDPNASTGLFRAIHDRIGFIWSGPLFNDSDTNHGWANAVNNPGNSYTLNVFNRQANSGVLFRHDFDVFSTGAVVSQIEYGTFSNTRFEVGFSYYHVDGPNGSSAWEAVETALEWILGISIPTPVTNFDVDAIELRF